MCNFHRACIAQCTGLAIDIKLQYSSSSTAREDPSAYAGDAGDNKGNGYESTHPGELVILKRGAQGVTSTDYV
jgi:hypothetical protein